MAQPVKTATRLGNAVRGAAGGLVGGASFSAGLIPALFSVSADKQSREGLSNDLDAARLINGKMTKEQLERAVRSRVRSAESSKKLNTALMVYPAVGGAVLGGALGALAKRASAADAAAAAAAPMGHLGRKLIGAGVGGAGALGATALLQGADRRADRDMASVGALSSDEARANSRRRAGAMAALGVMGGAVGAATQSRRLQDYLSPPPPAPGMVDKARARVRNAAEEFQPGGGAVADKVMDKIKNVGQKGYEALRNGVVNGAPNANASGLEADVTRLGSETYEAGKRVAKGGMNKAQAGARKVVDVVRNAVGKIRP